jgi:hypothetical protein
MAGYTRQSTFADGDTITAALFNNEYNQLVNAFSNTSGHAHDGTAANGPVIGLIGDAGETTPLNKVLIDTVNNYIEFYVDVSSSSVQQLYIADGAIVPVTDNDIDLGTSSLEFKDLYLDGTATIDTLTVDEAATIGTTLGVTGATTLSSTLGVTGATTLSSTLGVTGAATLSSTLAVTGTSTLTGNVTASNDLSVGGNLTVTGNATISGNLTFGDADTDSITLTADVASNIVPDTDDTYDLGTATKQWRNLYIDGTAEVDTLSIDGTAVTSTAAELNILDGVTATAAEINTLDGITATVAELNILDGVTSTATELNIMDGDTAATATTLADADRVVVNDAGVMKQVALTDFETYFESALDTLSNVTTVGALNAGSITSGFGAIDNGSSNITTTGTVTYGSLSDGTITITAFADEDDMVSNSATLVPTQQSVKAYVDAQVTAQDLDFQGDTGGALSIDLDSESLTIAGGTGLDTVGSGNTVTVNIDSTVATLTGTQTLTNKTLTSPDINTPDIDGGTIDGTVIGGATPAAADFTTMDTTGNASVGGDLSVTGDLTINGTTTTVNSTTVTVDDPIFTLGGDTAPASDDNKDRGIEFRWHNGTAAKVGFFGYDDSASVFTFIPDATNTSEVFSGSAGDVAFGNIAGTLTTAAQTNITSVGTLADLTVTGEITANGGIALGDNDKATFGDSDIFEIYTDGTDSFIKETGAGSLKLLGTNIDLANAAGTELGLRFVTNDAVTLYYDGSPKLATTATGIDVTGTAVVDGLTVSGALDSGDITITDTSGDPFLKLATSEREYVVRIDNDDSDKFQIRDATGAATRVTLDTSGNVGIATTTPRALLDIGGSESSSAVGDGNLVVKTTTTNDSAIVIQEASGTEQFALGVNVDGDFVVTNSGSTVPFIIQDSGNVGIGTDSPNEILELSQNQNPHIRFNNEDFSVLANDIFGTLEWYTNDGSSSGTGIAAEIRAYADVDFIGSTRSTNIDFLTASGTAAPTARMTIHHDGNVGIGTDSPSQTLDVVGTFEVDHGNYSGNDVVNVSTDQFDAGASFATGEFLLFGDHNGTKDKMLSLKKAGTDVFMVDSGGLVGIGTSSPADKLDIVGTGDETGLSIASGGNTGVNLFEVTYSGGTRGSSFTIDDSENVGIGTNDPQSMLELDRSTNGFNELRLTNGRYNTNSIGFAISARGYQNVEAGRIEFLRRGAWNESDSTKDSDMVFSTTLNGSSEETMRIQSNGDVAIGSTSSGDYRLKVRAINSTEGTSGKNAIFETFGGAGNVYIFNALGTGVSTAGSVIWVQKNSSTSRSINAAGTVNASGADYAEYMKKSSSCGTIAKGDVCGVDSSGELTDVYADAVSFVVKSTNPSYVGGDTWGADDLNLSEEELEIERQKYDRIAFSGQVPVNITGSFNVGDYVYPQANGSAIECVAKSSPTFEEYQKCVGKVWAIEDDGRPRIAVKIG